jgi:hypothetical protein
MSKRPRMSRVIKIYGSEILSAVAYDPDTHVLDVRLHSGAKYRYREIYAGTFAKLVTSKSPGKVYNALVKRAAAPGYYGMTSSAPRKAYKLRRASL